MRTPPFELHESTEAIINGRKFHILEINNLTGAVQAKCDTEGHTVSFKLSELVEFHQEGRLTFLSLSGTQRQDPKEQRGGPIKFSAEPLTPEQRKRFLKKLSYVTAARWLSPIGPNNKKLAKCIEEVAARIKDEKPPSTYAVYRWIRRYIRSGYNAAVFALDGGVHRTRTPKIEQPIKTALHKNLDELLGSNIGATLSGITNKALALTARDLGFTFFVAPGGGTFVAEDFLSTSSKKIEFSSIERVEINGIQSPLKVSRETIRQIALRTDRYERTRRHHGRAAADRNRKPRTGEVNATRPQQMLEIDNFLLDVHLICPRTGVRLGRPWLTLAIDAYSGMVLGYHLSFAAPSTASVLAAVRHAIMPKHQQVLDILGEGFEWPAYGIPDVVIMDNGLDFVSLGGREALEALACLSQFCPPRAPWYKGSVERFGGTINTEFIHWLPGATLGKVLKNVEYDARQHALLSFDEFEKLLLQYIVTVHNHSKRGKRHGSCFTLWVDGVAKWPVRMPESKDALDIAVAMTEKRVLRQTGVEFKGLYYQSEQLGEVWNRVADGTRVSFKVNPLDIRSVMVESPLSREWLRVPCVRRFPQPMPLNYHLRLEEVGKLAGLNLNEEWDLAMAQQTLSNDTQALLLSKGKKSLRASEAEMTRQASNHAHLDSTASPKAKGPSLDGQALIASIQAVQQSLNAPEE